MTSYHEPDQKGHFGDFGGRYVPETLMPAILELEKAYEEAMKDDQFQAELTDYLSQYVGRETPLYYAERLTKKLGGAQIYLRSEEHTSELQSRGHLVCRLLLEKKKHVLNLLT